MSETKRFFAVLIEGGIIGWELQMPFLVCRALAVTRECNLPA